MNFIEVIFFFRLLVRPLVCYFVVIIHLVSLAEDLLLTAYVYDILTKAFAFSLNFISSFLPFSLLGVKMIPPGIHFVYYSSVNIKVNDKQRFHHVCHKEIFEKHY